MFHQTICTKELRETESEYSALTFKFNFAQVAEQIGSLCGFHGVTKTWLSTANIPMHIPEIFIIHFLLFALTQMTI